ncbi:MAG: polysaccharide deacetylase family protein [Sphingobium sp.]
MSGRDDGGEALVLTYHSVSDAAGPTSISPDTFAMQMETLAACGYDSATLDEFLDWHEGKRPLGRKLLITFDDGFSDFVDHALPILEDHGFGALMFVPTRKLGAPEDWEGANRPARRLMHGCELAALQARGVEFGAHSRTHANLPRLSADEREEEIAASGADLADLLGRPTKSFAAPYGAVDADTVAAIGRHYPIAFGTRFAPALAGVDRHDIPRIDMHYFRARAHWRNFLEGRRGYFRLRQALRWLGNKVRGNTILQGGYS